jgi:hypothetical protein
MVSIHTIDGSLVRVATLNGRENHLDLSGLSPGMYLLSVLTGSHRSTEKLVL